MASGIGETLLHEILGLFQGESVAAQSAYAFDLTSNVPNASGAATLFTNATAPGYNYTVIDATPAQWDIINSRTATNKQLILLNPATTGPWPSAQGGVLRRMVGDPLAPSGTGDFFGHILQGRIIDAGERFKILPGGLRITIPPAYQNVSDAFAANILGLLQGTNINAPAEIQLHFGKLNPSSTGIIGQLSGGGYTPVTIPCDATNFNDPALRAVTNKIEWDHTMLWTSEVDVSDIISGAISVNGTEWIRGVFSKSKSLKTGDNLRIPLNSFKVVG